MLFRSKEVEFIRVDLGILLGTSVSAQYHLLWLTLIEGVRYYLGACVALGCRTGKDGEIGEL